MEHSVGEGLSHVDRVYLPLAQVDPPEAMALIRGAEVSPELVSELRRRVAGVSPDMPVWGVQTLAEAFRYLTRVYRAMAGMAVGGGAAGLLVAVVGMGLAWIAAPLVSIAFLGGD